MGNWSKLAKYIQEFDKHSYMKNPKEDLDFFDTWELDMAKSFVCDNSEGAIRISKIILALNDIDEIKIKIE